MLRVIARTEPGGPRLRGREGSVDHPMDGAGGPDSACTADAEAQTQETSACRGPRLRERRRGIDCHCSAHVGSAQRNPPCAEESRVKPSANLTCTTRNQSAYLNPSFAPLRHCTLQARRKWAGCSIAISRRSGTTAWSGTRTLTPPDEKSRTAQSRGSS